MKLLLVPSKFPVSLFHQRVQMKVSSEEIERAANREIEGAA